MTTRNQGGHRRLLTAGAALLVGSLGLGACSGGGSGSPGAGGSGASGSAPSPAVTGSTGQPAGGGNGAATGRSVTDIAHLQDLLGPGDFAAVGVSGAGTPTVNPGDPGSIFAVYAGKSAGTGGIELDVVVGDDASAMGEVYAPMAVPFSGIANGNAVDVAGADAAVMRTDNALDSGGQWAAIVVQKGKLVFLIGIPTSEAAASQLMSLAKLVVERGSALE